VSSEEPASISFLDRELPAPFRVRVVVLLPGTAKAYDASEWTGELVVLESGRLELECNRRRRRALPAGAVFWLQGLPLRALHNPGTLPAVLSAVSRARDEFAQDPRLEG
jgi:hypothetical protein